MTTSRAPDLRLAGFQLWVHGYQHPEATDAWDGNWLRVAAHCGADGASVDVSGSILETVSIARFGAQMEALYESLEGAAELGTDEPELGIRLTGDGRGQIRMQVEITPRPGYQEHAFLFDIDQSYLPSAVADCKALLQRYPIREPKARGF